MCLNKDMKNKIIILISGILVLVVLSIFGNYFFSHNKKLEATPSASPAFSPKLIGGDKDAHGCLIAAGYSWCEAKNKCLRTWEENCDENEEQIIQGLLAKKYNKAVDQVKVTTTKESGAFWSGSVLFGKGGSGESGIVLATKVNGVWEIVFDGNGSIDCAKMRQQFGFPDEILKPNYCD